MKASLATLPLVAAFLTTPAWAHPGDHSSLLSQFVSHLLSEPDHLALVLSCVAAAVGLAWYQRRGRQRRDDHKVRIDRRHDRDL